MRYGWIGLHIEGLSALEGLLAAGLRLECIITLSKIQARSRSGAIDYEPLARAHGIPIHYVEKINDPESIALLKSLELDIVFVIGWSQIIGPEALATVRRGMIGAHASLLPHNRGSAPINWSIIHGETVSGNSLIWLSDGLDDGDIIDQRSFEISVYDTCDTLYKKVTESNLAMLRGAIERIERGERLGIPQHPDKEPVLPRRRPADGMISWGKSARAVYDFIRGITKPYPGAFSHLDGVRWYIWQSAILPDSCSIDSIRPGTIIGPVFSPVIQACGLAVACGSGSLVIVEAQKEGGALLRGPDLSVPVLKGKVFSDEA